KAGGPVKVADKVLFDFEDDADLKAWSNLELPAPAPKEPAAKVELSTDNATSGKRSLKITFAGGRWPTLTTTAGPDDWMAWETFQADGAVSKPCLLGFSVLQENSKRGGDWDGAVSRWCKTELLTPGKHTISAPLHPNEWSSIRPVLDNKRVLGKVERFEVFLY